MIELWGSARTVTAGHPHCCSSVVSPIRAFSGCCCFNFGCYLSAETVSLFFLNSGERGHRFPDLRMDGLLDGANRAVGECGIDETTMIAAELTTDAQIR